jgi:L-histidine N-alpha-methyltransferase
VQAELRFQLTRSGLGPDRKTTMVRDVRAGLSTRPRSIPPKYFYDDVGSRLFDAICDLPEYYLTRAEAALLASHAEPIVAQSGADVLIEIGSGMARKTSPLLTALCRRSAGLARRPPPLYVPFDIDADTIRRSATILLKAHPTLRVHGLAGDFSRDCKPMGLVAPPSVGTRLFAFLGSTIGNLDEDEAPALLRAIAHLMTPSDRFLLGLDLVKDVRHLHAAYNDASGVTAAFNRNVLRVVARELGGDVDPDAFGHYAFYDERLQRVEMHLVSERRQTLTLTAADLHVDFDAGEHVLTEISRKFTRESAERTLVEGGMALTDWLTAPHGAFALCVARRASDP